MVPRKRNRLFIALAAFGFLVAGAEVGLRVLLGAGRPLLLQADPEIGYLFKPDQTVTILGHRVHINAFHQRARDVEPAPARGGQRILLIGDSVAFGGVYMGQDETMGAYLERELTGGAGRVEVLTAAAGSWSIGNELAYMQRFGVVGSTVVVWQIGSHDLAQGKSNGSAVGHHPSMPDRKPVSALTETFERVVWPRFMRPHLAGWLDGAAEKTAAPDPLASDAVDTNLRWLEEGVALIRAGGAVPVILHTPDRFEVTGEPPDPQKAAVYREQRQRFLAVAAKLGVPVINLAEAWRGAPQARAWFRDGVHLTAPGNAAAAQVVAEHLSRQGLAVVGGDG